MKHKYFGHVQEDMALSRMRQAQQERAHQEMVLAGAIMTELIRQNQRDYEPDIRHRRTRGLMEQVFGSKRQFGLLQRKLEERTGGILSRLHSDMPWLRQVDLLVFSYSAAGLSVDLMVELLDAHSTGYVTTLRSRLRDGIQTLETPRKYEYLALLGPKWKHFGGETALR